MLLRALLAFLVATGGMGCGSSESPPDEPACVPGMAAAALAPPRGLRPGQPYRWLSRSLKSPLGVTIETYGLAVDGVPVFGRHEVEIYDRRGELTHRAGSGGEVLAELERRGPAAWASWHHPLASSSSSRLAEKRADPLVRSTQRPVWHYAAGDLVPAVVAERLDLTRDPPVGDIRLLDAVTGAELARRNAIYDIADPEYLVYARDDGRPLCSPLGDTMPHPTGAPDGRVPPLVTQSAHRQSGVVAALPDPWLPAAATETRGNNVVAFFDSLLDSAGKLVDLTDASGNNTPQYGPEPDTAHGDFFASAAGDRFAFIYDPTKTRSEYFQDGQIGSSAPPPNPNDSATEAKIVQAFYSTNWLHDFFYRAGFDEKAGNAQASSFGRGGADCDPLIVHAGFSETFTFPAPDGQSPVIELGVNRRSGSRRDASMDFTIVAHEWGHTLIGALAGGIGDTDALGNLQGQEMHEGIADFVGILTNVSSLDPLGAYAVGSYDNLDYVENRSALPAVEAPADSMYYGIRRYPYSLDFHKNPLTFRHLAEPPPTDMPYYNWKGRGPILSESHTAGEVFSEALFHCFGNIVAAHPGASFEDQRARMAQVVVAGLAAFPDHPSMLEARNAFLDVIRLAHPADDYPACRAGFAARGMGADALGPDKDFGEPDPLSFPPYDPADVKESFLDRDRALRPTSSGFTADTAGGAGRGTVDVELRNTGLVALSASAADVTAAVPAAATFPNGAHADLGPLSPEKKATAHIGVALNACLLPPHPSQPGFTLFEYTVKTTSSDGDEVTRETTFDVAVPPPAGPCPATR